jgi:radical SAM protein with 4Fe4S-binding SPASM domain
MSTSAWLSLIRHLAECKVFKILVNGGEPFVRDDIFVLLEEIDRQPFAVSLFTNGTLITESVARRLGELRFEAVSISLDGSTPQVHDSLRGEGAFDRTVAGIERLVRERVTVGISSVVTSLNVSDLSALVSLAKELGTQGITFNNLQTSGRSVSSGLSLSKSEDSETAKTLLALRERYGRFVSSTYIARANIYVRRAAPDAEARHLATCSAAKSSCSIRPDGEVIPCNYLWDMTCGNVRVGPFREIWRHSAGLARFRALSRLTVDDIPGCRGCKFSSVCDAGCRANAYAVCGSFTAPDPFCWYEGGS